MKLCGAHRLGKPNRNRARPLIARFTCRADRDRVWKARYRLKNSRISMGEDLPRHTQEINDDPFFFENFFKHLLTFKCEEIILGGDFNLVLDVQEDKKGGNPVTQEKSLQKVKYIIDSLDLTDIWLFLNADTKRFTRKTRNPEVLV